MHRGPLCLTPGHMSPTNSGRRSPTTGALAASCLDLNPKEGGFHGVLCLLVPILYVLLSGVGLIHTMKYLRLVKISSDFRAVTLFAATNPCPVSRTLFRAL